MAQYDGSIRIGTGIDTQGFKDGEKEIEAESRRAASTVSSSVGGVEKEVESLGRSFSETAVKIAELNTKMELLKNQKIPTEEYTNAQNIVEKLQKSLEDAYTRKERFLETGGNESNRTFKGIEYDIEKLKIKLRQAEQDVKSLVDTGKDFTLGSDTEQFSKYEAQLAKLKEQKAEEQRLAQIKVNATVSDQQIIDLLERRKQLIAEIKDMEAAGVGLGYKQYEDANRELGEINGKVKDYRKNIESVPEKFDNMRKSANKAFTAVSSGTKKSSGLLSTFSSRLKGIALSLLIFNWISKAFNAMISGMKKGFENLAGYSDSYAQSVQSMKNAMSTLGNQFAAAFAPIVQMVIPWLNSLIGVITTAVTYVSQFIAVLSGKSTFTKAKKVQDDYNKSLGGTAKAADKARGALAKFDDLDVLEKKDNTSGGGAGAENAGADMFEEVPVDTEVLSFWQRVQEAMKPVIEYARQLKDIFSQGFFDGLGDWEYRWESIKKSISSIKESLANIFADPEVLSSADSWAQSVAYMLGSVTGSVASIGLTIATNLIGGIETYLEQNKERIKSYLISMFDIGSDINETISGLFTSIAYVFEAFSGETAQQLTANLIGIFTDAFMGAQEIVLKISRDILNVIIQPFVDNKEEFRTALEGFLGVLEEVTGTIKETIDHTFDKLNEVYDEHFKPFFDSVAEGLSEITESFLKFWNENVQPILDKLAKKFDEIMSQHIQPMIDNVIELVGKLVDALKMLWEVILQPFIQWIIDNILPVILPIFEDLYEGILEAVGYISDIINSIITIMQGVIDFIVGVFTGDWDRAWNGISEIVTGFMNKIKVTIDLVLSVIKTIVKTVLNIISAIWTTIFTEIGSFVKTITNAILSTITGFMSSAKDGISKVLGNIKTTWNTIWSSLKDSVSTIFTQIWNTIRRTINNILGGIEGMANGVVNGVNAVINALNGIGFDMPDWLGGESFRLNIPTLPEVSIPRLATGAVIRGGNPFMAILGDQPAGQTNIEAPLETIRQAVREELSGITRGYPAGGQTKVVLNVNGTDVGEAILDDLFAVMSRRGYDVEVLGVT
ncbi:MAG: hypothetical protein HFH88_17290 [Lachnospiraceae bacterium]|nr:hypothetical protein [Lachnospiraceae bacterium]